MLNLRAPSVGLSWLPTFASDIVELFKSVMSTPFRFLQTETANVDATTLESKYGFIIDLSEGLPYFSDGVNWVTFSLSTHAHAASAITNTPAGNIAATNVQAALNELDTEKLAASSYTAADVLAKLLTVDGPGSGLDADLLDGSSSAAFAAAAHNHSAADLTSGIVPDARMPNLTGDVTTVEGAVATTLATVNGNVGSFGSTSAVPIITVNAKGLVTAVSTAALGTAAVKNTGTSGDAVPVLNGAATTWANGMTLSAGGFTVTDGAVNITRSGTGGHTITGQGVVLKVNSSNSNANLIELQQAGTIRGYFGANATGPMMADSGANLKLQVSSTGVDITGEARCDSFRIDVAPTVAAAIVSTHKLAISCNGTNYFFLLSNV